MEKNNDLGDQVIIALRRVIRAIDLHSRTLVSTHGLTGPQALILKALQYEGLTAGELANRVSLSQGTVTDILNRLEGVQPGQHRDRQPGHPTQDERHRLDSKSQTTA